MKKLKAFQKVFLKAAEAKDVTFTLTGEDLKFYNSDLKWIHEAGDFKVFVDGNSRDVQEGGFELSKYEFCFWYRH